MSLQRSPGSDVNLVYVTHGKDILNCVKKSTVRLRERQAEMLYHTAFLRWSVGHFDCLNFQNCLLYNTVTASICQHVSFGLFQSNSTNLHPSWDSGMEDTRGGHGWRA